MKLLKMHNVYKQLKRHSETSSESHEFVSFFEMLNQVQHDYYSIILDIKHLYSKKQEP